MVESLLVQSFEELDISPYMVGYWPVLELGQHSLYHEKPEEFYFPLCT